MALRRSPGDASVYRDGDRWRGSVELGRGPDGRRPRKKVSARTRAEILLKIREIQRLQSAGQAIPNDKVTLAGFLAQSVTDTLPGTIADGTLDNYADTIRLHITPTLGHLTLSRITVADVNRLLAAKRTAGYSANTLRLIRTILRRGLGHAEREGLITRNVAALSTPPRLARTPGRALTTEQITRLLQTLAGHRLEALFLIMLAFGLRRGEALGLRWCDLDPDRATLAVTHGVRRVRNRANASSKTVLVLGELKTARSRRTLYLTPPLLDALQSHQAAQDATRRLVGPDWVDTDLIFTTEFGAMLDPDNNSHLLSRITARARLGHWHAHELRHSAASVMLAQGTPCTSSPKSSATPASPSPRTSTATSSKARNAPPPQP